MSYDLYSDLFQCYSEYCIIGSEKVPCHCRNCVGKFDAGVIFFSPKQLLSQPIYFS